MAKVKRVYVCQSCGSESAKWIGKCPSCGEWNTYTEEVIVEKKGAPSASLPFSKTAKQGARFSCRGTIG